jgi:hypothetical protein
MAPSFFLSSASIDAKAAMWRYRHVVKRLYLVR